MPNAGSKRSGKRPRGKSPPARPARRPAAALPAGSGIGPLIDDVHIKDLHSKEHYEVLTDDGWTLVVTRYKPVKQAWNQPLFEEPLLLVHGFSQNRHAWTAGEFVKDMLYFGADIHILELRGHGLSNVKLQYDMQNERNRPLPDTINYTWDFSHYFLYDVPAALAAIKRLTGKRKVSYCGHSMGGMIGYGLASQRDDLLAMATIGSPVDLGAEALWIRLAALAGGFIPLLQSILRMADGERVALFAAIQKNPTLKRMLPFTRFTRPLNTDIVPMDWFLGSLYRSIAVANDAIPAWIPKEFRLFNPAKVALEDVRWLLKEGGEREPVRVLLHFLRWIRNREMVCYTSGYDFRANFHKIRIPLTIVFGDEDVLAGMKSTRSIYEQAQSDYLVWRPVRGNSHIEITMGDDIRQICYDIKNLMEFAISHQDRPPRLPRRKLHRRNLLMSVRRGRKRRAPE